VMKQKWTSRVTANADQAPVQPKYVIEHYNTKELGVHPDVRTAVGDKITITYDMKFNESKILEWEMVTLRRVE